MSEFNDTASYMNGLDDDLNFSNNNNNNIDPFNIYNNITNEYRF